MLALRSCASSISGEEMCSVRTGVCAWLVGLLCFVLNLLLSWVLPLALGKHSSNGRTNSVGDSLKSKQISL